ncbi:MAG: hypothetical protein KU28_00995 [Sulfurovum sp. PC08-66]|nr:MAG: hypothetical protein KU28_00995 [Sulfurovum sp. PC08-66]KIM12534.1 MAG: hypothetical protein KU37_01110 [Sulfuricurvum sp. PC08-66]
MLSIAFASPFAQAQKNLIASTQTIAGHTAYATAQGWLVLSPTKPKNVTIRYANVSMGLYLIEHKVPKKVLKIVDKTPKSVAAITPTSIIPVTVLQEQNSVIALGKIDKKIAWGTPLMGACGTLRGFVVGEGIITSHYLLDFLAHRDSYRDIGMTLEPSTMGMRVESVNPFFAHNPFAVGDVILYHDAKKESIHQFNNAIGESTIGTKHYFRVLREGTLIGFTAYTLPFLGGGILAHTYLEHFGALWDKNLKIVEVKEGTTIAQLGLKPTDKLVALNGVVVTTDRDVRKALNVPIEESLSMLIEREGLQFLVYVPRNYLHTKSHR